MNDFEKMKDALIQIKEILENSNVYPSLSGKLYLEDSKKIIEIIKEVIGDEDNIQD